MKQLTHLPLRTAIGAYFLNTGLSKRDLEGEAAEAMHGMAAAAMPQIKQIPPQRFARLLSAAEISLGVALLVPVVPSALVGAALAGFAGGLMKLYWKTPGMHEPGNPRPTQQGVPLAKDVWLLGAGLTLVLDDMLIRGHQRMHRKMHRTMRRKMMMHHAMHRMTHRKMHRMHHGK